DGGAGNGLRETSGENSVASDVGSLFTYLHDAAGNHVVDKRGIELIALDQALEREAEEIDRVPGFQHAVAPAERRANGIDDYRFSFHFVASLQTAFAPWFQSESFCLV